MYTHIWTVHKRITQGGQSYANDDQQFATPGKDADDSPMSFGAARTRSKSMSLSAMKCRESTPEPKAESVPPFDLQLKSNRNSEP